MPEEISKIFKYAPLRAEIFGVCRLLIIVNRTDCGSKPIRSISPTSGKVRFANRDFLMDLLFTTVHRGCFTNS